MTERNYQSVAKPDDPPILHHSTENKNSIKIQRGNQYCFAVCFMLKVPSFSQPCFLYSRIN